jgi:hypothetical protein
LKEKRSPEMKKGTPEVKTGIPKMKKRNFACFRKIRQARIMALLNVSETRLALRRAVSVLIRPFKTDT